MAYSAKSAGATGPAGDPGIGSDVAGAATAPLYHADVVSAFHIGADSVTMTLASRLPASQADSPDLRAELHLNFGAADFESLLRRLIEIRARMVETGVLRGYVRDDDLPAA